MSALPTFDELRQQSERLRRARAKDMKTVQDALEVMWIGYQRLKDLGFADAMYCPKDGTPFEVVECGSTGIFRCTYSGEWPDGYYMIEDGGDIYPSRQKSLLWRSLKDPTP